jgi:hypothetical protein
VSNLSNGITKNIIDMDISKAEFLRRLKTGDTFCCFVANLALNVHKDGDGFKLNTNTPKWIVEKYYEMGLRVLKGFEIKKASI